MSKSNCRILYVDDHDDSAEMIKLLLSPMGYDVRIARTMDEALELARSEQIDLYVLDKGLPDGSGVDLCKQLNELTPTVPCVVYSGDSYEVHRQEAVAAGAHAYITKPDVDELIKTVHRFLSENECATA
jgi:CheY-like chemotaxis protein